MENSIGKSFKQVCKEWWQKESEKPENFGRLTSPVLAEAFADYLDKFQFLTPQLQLLAMLQARKIDQEYIGLLVDALGISKASEIARQIHAKHQIKKADDDSTKPLSI